MIVPAVPMVMGLGPQEIILILLVLVLLFGAKKLPELARGSGRALRIFKAETKGLMDEDEAQKTEEQRHLDEQRQLEAQRRSEAAAHVDQPEEQPRPDAER